MNSIIGKGWWVALLGVSLMAFFIMIKPPWLLLAGLLVVEDPLEPADVLIVLGGDSGRELHAAELYRQGLAPKVIMTGCGGAAGQMASRAVRAGVREKDILIESKSKSTYDNAVFSRDIVMQNSFKSAIVVSSPYHMRRSKLVFERVFKNTGVKLLYSSAKGSKFNPGSGHLSDNDLRLTQKEYLKLIYYWFRYW